MKKGGWEGVNVNRTMRAFWVNFPHFLLKIPLDSGDSFNPINQYCDPEKRSQCIFSNFFLIKLFFLQTADGASYKCCI